MTRKDFTAYSPEFIRILPICTSALFPSTHLPIPVCHTNDGNGNHMMTFATNKRFGLADLTPATVAGWEYTRLLLAVSIYKVVQI
jgi:hypothetical protein